MSKIIHCRINMFDTNALIMIEEDGIIKEDDKIYIPLNKLDKQLPIIASQYSCNKVHFIGQTDFVKGLANNLKKHNLDFNALEIGVN